MTQKIQRIEEKVSIFSESDEFIHRKSRQLSSDGFQLPSPPHFSRKAKDLSALIVASIFERPKGAMSRLVGLSVTFMHHRYT